VSDTDLFVAMVNPVFTTPVYHDGREEGDPTMMGLMLFAAAANAPMMLARADEAQWHLFVRASLERQAPPRDARLRQLEGVVRRLGAERAPVQQVAGPAGL
jgi:hypothetical protein